MRIFSENSLLSNIVFFCYHFRKSILKITYYITSKLYSDTSSLISYDKGKTKFSNFDSYNHSNELSMIKYRINNIIHYLRVLSKEDITKNKNYIGYLKTDPKILSITILLNDKEYNLSFSEYYLIGNKILDYKFINWYFNYYYTINYITDYKITIIDGNINMYTLLKNNYILLGKNTFYVKTI